MLLRRREMTTLQGSSSSVGTARGPEYAETTTEVSPGGVPRGVARDALHRGPPTSAASRSFHGGPPTRALPAKPPW